MRGSIRERSPGHWAIIIDVPDPATGKRRRKWHSFTGTKREAQIECSRIITALSGGTYIDPTRMMVAVYLDRWLDHVKANVSPRTHERYCEIVHNNIVPLLGAVRLTELKPIQVSAAYAKALVSGRADGKGGLSARTVHHMHRVLFAALRQAVRWEMIARNPADLDKKDRPKVERKPVLFIDSAATAGALEDARALRLFIPVVLGSLCGLRRGEITAVRRKSVDLDRAQLAVIASTEQTRAGCREKETKSSRCRTIALPAYVVEELRKHFLSQAEELLKIGVRVTGETHVFTQADGSPLQPRSLTRAVTKFMKDRGETVRLHGLRHSHASQLLAANVHPKIVQERFGHSSVAVTMDIYSHLMPNMQADAAARVDETIQAAINARAKAKG